MNLNLKNKILLNQIIPSIFGTIGVYMIFSYLKNGTYKIANWDAPYLHIIVFGILFWLYTSNKIEDITKEDNINVKKKDKFWLILRIFLFCTFSGISVYSLTRFFLDANYIFTESSIIEGIFTGGFIFWLENNSLSILTDGKKITTRC